MSRHVNYFVSGPGELKPKEGRAAYHSVAGKIHYTPGSPDEDGVIIYLKPTLLSSDPCQLLGYTAVNDKFPHDPTADQWFDETHFENYRALGKAAGTAASKDIAVGRARRWTL